MLFEEAVRLTEVMMGFAFVQQSIEHLRSFRQERILFFIRLILVVLLIIGFQSSWVIALLFVLGLTLLVFYQGAYNGGSDRIGLLVLSCLCLVHFLPARHWQEVVFAYLAIQLILSYFISGWVKVIKADWRSGRALCDVFQFSVYPVSESLRQWTTSPKVMWFMSWMVIGFELLFPIALLSKFSLLVALVIAASFHFSNACLFGLNRFFWIWIACYPSLIWFQQRIFL